MCATCAHNADARAPIARAVPVRMSILQKAPFGKRFQLWQHVYPVYPVYPVRFLVI